MFRVVILMVWVVAAAAQLGGTWVELSKSGANLDLVGNGDKDEFDVLDCASGARDTSRKVCNAGD